MTAESLIYSPVMGEKKNRNIIRLEFHLDVFKLVHNLQIDSFRFRITLTRQERRVTENSYHRGGGHVDLMYRRQA